MEDNYELRNSTTFPHNLTLEDCRAAIKGTKEFKEFVTEDQIFFNYVFCTNSSFPSVNVPDHKDAFYYKVRRECRGLIFDAKTGKVTSRRFQKFFNVNEKEETHEKNIDLKKPHVILEKLDGSLVAPFLVDGKVSFGTKSGMTDMAKMITEKFLLNNTTSDYYKFCQEWLEKEFTPMFEWLSAKSQIVVKYDSDALMALRSNITGDYISYYEMVEHAAKYNVPTVKNKLDLTTEYGINHVLNAGLRVEGAEGYVLRFDDGTMYKIKSTWYCNLHRKQANALGDTSHWHERHIWAYALDRTLDDVLANLVEGEKSKAARKFEEELWLDLTETASRIYSEYKNCPKKEFAAMLKARKDLSATIKAVYFIIFDSPTIDEGTALAEIVKLGKKLVVNSAGFEKVRELAPNAKFVVNTYNNNTKE